MKMRKSFSAKERVHYKYESYGLINCTENTFKGIRKDPMGLFIEDLKNILDFVLEMQLHNWWIQDERPPQECTPYQTKRFQLHCF